MVKSLRQRRADRQPAGLSMIGAGGGTRTLTLLPELDFESSASTNSAIPAVPSSTRAVTRGRALPARGGGGIIAETATRFKLRNLEQAPRGLFRGSLAAPPCPSDRPTASPISTTRCRRS